MQVGHLFDLFTDAKDLADFFEGVDSKEQLISRLELLKRQGTDDLLACIVALPITLDRFYKDTFEMSASMDDNDEIEDDEMDAELENLARKLDEIAPASPSENENSDTEVTVADLKSDVQPTE
jgi:hypothetical protein